MYYFAPILSAFSNIKADVSKLEATFHNVIMTSGLGMYRNGLTELKKIRSGGGVGEGGGRE